MLDVPESWIKNENHFIQRNALITNEPYINKEKIELALKTLSINISFRFQKHFHAHFQDLEEKMLYSISISI